MEKRVLTSYKKLPKEVKKALKEEYPFGFENLLTTIKIISNGESVNALLYNYNDTEYLIKYTKMKKRNINTEEIEDNDNQPDDELNISTGGEWYEDNN